MCLRRRVWVLDSPSQKPRVRGNAVSGWGCQRTLLAVRTLGLHYMCDGCLRDFIIWDFHSHPNNESRTHPHNVNPWTLISYIWMASSFLFFIISMPSKYNEIESMAGGFLMIFFLGACEPAPEALHPKKKNHDPPAGEHGDREVTEDEERVGWDLTSKSKPLASSHSPVSSSSHALPWMGSPSKLFII